MSKKKKGISAAALLLIGAIVFGGAAWCMLYASGDATAREWVAKVGFGEKVSVEGVAWVWERTERADGSVVEPKDGSFVLSLIVEEKRVSSTTDCNSLMGSYLLSTDNSLRFGALASTKMFCAGSMESIYAEQLTLVNSYHVSGSTLYLKLDRDFGTMVFRKK